jgi:hypothetical protein
MGSAAEDLVVTPAWAASRQELFDLVGGDDPAEVQASTREAIHARIAAASEAGVLRTRPAEGEWSVVELIGHLLDAEIFVSARYRMILAHDRPRLEGYDQDLVAAASRHLDADPDLLLSAWEGLRRANLDLWSRSAPDQRAREGIHLECGPSTFEVLFVEMAGHDRLHLAQIDPTLETVRPA